MKIYLLFFISLNLAYRGNARNIIDVLNLESTLNSTENPIIPNTESTLGSKKNTFILHTEDTLNSAEKLFTSRTEITPNSKANTTTMDMTEQKQSECPENMTPDFRKSENDPLKCRCLRPFVVVTETLCSELFREGPCGPGNYLVQTESLDTEFSLPNCIPNPCLEDGLVPNNGTCIGISSLPPCKDGQRYYIEATMEIGCKFGAFHTVSLFSWGSDRGCPPGYRKDKKGVCRRKI